MQIRAVVRRSLSDSVYQQLLAGILGGEIRPGESLPAERALSAELGVNRAAVREALKRLQQLGLVAVQQGEATRVLDHRRFGGLELLMPLLFRSGRLEPKVARGLVDFRSLLGPEIASQAARHRGEADMEVLRAAMSKLEDAAADDAVGLQRAYLDLWRGLTEASGNPIYRLAFNTMDRAWQGVQDLIAPALHDETRHRDAQRRLVSAVGRGWHNAAHKAASELVARGARGMYALVDMVEES